MSLEKAWPWVLRVAWATLPLVLGPTLSDRLHDWDAATRSAASLMLWVGWAGVAVASCVALTFTLVIVRVGIAAAVVTGAIATAPGVVAALVAAAAAMRPETSEWFVNGSAYANERRYPLRVPSALLLGPLWLAPLVLVGVPVGGVLLLASKQWVAGVAVLVVGAVPALVAARALFGLARRWVVFVPAGVVLHDPMSLTDPVLFERPLIETFRAAPADTDSLDLTMGALGLALELVLFEKVPMVRNTGRKSSEQGSSGRLLCTPTRPGRVLEAASANRIPVG